MSLATSFGLPGTEPDREDLLDPLQVRHFGDYELREEIARGGMGVVYRAYQTSLHREVAIKMILAGELAGSVALRMFQVEAKAAANLHHPNIVPVYEIGEHETQPYFTMRFVPGGRTIAHWAKKQRGDHRAIAAAAAKVARAVAYAHTHSILHRDLKPSNVLWDPEAGPQVTDFGLAKILEEGSGSNTRTVLSLGSPSYMAPEQMDGRTAAITTITDVYGLGAILYEMLSGRPPFAGASPLEVMRRAAEEAPAPLSGVPRDLQTICLKCLAKDPADRYPSAEALAEDLERFARGESVSVVPLSAPQTLWRWAKRRPLPAALILICALSILAGLGGVLWEWRKAETAHADQARTLARLRWQEVDQWLNEGDVSRALAYLASLIRAEPDRWPATMYAMSIVEQSHFPVLAGPKVHPPAKLIGAARLAPDGRWWVGAGEDRVVRVWETASGKEVAQFPVGSPVTAIDMIEGPFGFAVATQDGAITVHASHPTEAVSPSRSTTAPVKDLKFSADRSRLLARSQDRVEIWKMSQPMDSPLVLKLDGGLGGAGLSADGTRAAAWNAHAAAVWDTASGAELLRAAPKEAFRTGALAANGNRFALLDGQFTAHVWDVSSNKPFPPIVSELTYWGRLALDTAGERLTLCGGSNDLTVFDVASGLQVSPPMKHHYVVENMEVSPDGGRTASYGRDDVVRTWDARTGRAAMSGLPLGDLVRTSAGISLSRDGDVILTHTRAQGDAPETVSIWHRSVTMEPQRRSVEGARDLDAGCISPDGRLACLGLFPDTRCYVYEPATGRVLLDRKLEGGAYVHLLTPDLKKYYVLTAKGWLYGWSLETGEELWAPNHQPGFIRPAALSPDGTRIIAGHNDGNIRIYDTATGQLVQTLNHPGEIKTLYFAKDGSGRFVSGSTDGLAHAWDLRTGRMLQTFAGHTDAIISAVWSPDGRLIATGSFDRTARVWDAATGRPVGAILRHNGSLAQLEFSPDGRQLATACRDGTARLWDPRTGQPLSPPLLQGSACETVLFTRDGSTFLVYDHDGFRFWDKTTAEPVTVHYPEPTESGLGMDSENYRAILTNDGCHVFLGNAMNYGAYWTIPQPRGRAPAWLPDFLEMLAQVRVNESGEARPLARDNTSAVLEEIRSAPAADAFAAWARKILGQ